LLLVCALTSPFQIDIYGERYAVIHEEHYGEPISKESLTPRRFLSLVAQVHRIHKGGVFHNDLRPPNLIAPSDIALDIVIID